MRTSALAHARLAAAVALTAVACAFPASSALGQKRLAQRVAAGAEAAAESRAAARATSRYDATFRKYSKRYFGPNFDWRYFKAQGLAESGLDPRARSWVGARGIMQLMPSTFQEIQTRRRDLASIDDPEWNIAAGVMHDRYLWQLWADEVPDAERHRYMFGSYNAGEGTISRAYGVARAAQLDPVWTNIETIAPKVRRWRYRETLGYVRRIDANYSELQAKR